MGGWVGGGGGGEVRKLLKCFLERRDNYLTFPIIFNALNYHRCKMFAVEDKMF